MCMSSPYSQTKYTSNSKTYNKIQDNKSESRQMYASLVYSKYA